MKNEKNRRSSKVNPHTFTQFDPMQSDFSDSSLKREGESFKGERELQERERELQERERDFSMYVSMFRSFEVFKKIPVQKCRFFKIHKFKLLLLLKSRALKNSIPTSSRVVLSAVVDPQWSILKS